MVFSSKFSKFSKGENISLFMKNENEISVFYFNENVKNKIVNTTNGSITTNNTNKAYPYQEVIQINNYLITRMNKSIGIIKNEQ